MNENMIIILRKSNSRGEQISRRMVDDGECDCEVSRPYRSLQRFAVSLMGHVIFDEFEFIFAGSSVHTGN